MAKKMDSMDSFSQQAFTGEHGGKQCDLSKSASVDSVFLSGGGWGNPLERDAELVASEVRQGLITANGARQYGVTLTADNLPDPLATFQLRDEMKEMRQSAADVFDHGGSLRELFEKCKVEVISSDISRSPSRLNHRQTGLDPPSLPSGRKLRGPAAGLPHIKALHERRQREDRYDFGEDYERYTLASNIDAPVYGPPGKTCC